MAPLAVTIDKSKGIAIKSKLVVSRLYTPWCGSDGGARVANFLIASLMSLLSVRSLSTAGFLAAAVLSMSFAAEHVQTQKKVPQIVSVPNLMGMTDKEAQGALKAAGLSWSFDSRNTEPTMNPKMVGRVAGQEPAAGKQVRQSTSVAVRMYRAAPPVLVPNVVGHPEGMAAAVLQKIGLSQKRVESVTTDRELFGKILRQEPNAGTHVARNTVVTIFVGHGPRDIVVPNLIGMDGRQASHALASVGLNPANFPGKVPTTDSHKIGLVAEQSVAAGTRVDLGTKIGVKYYTRERVAVPSVYRATKDQAMATLQKAGFSVVVHEIKAARQIDVGHVIRQDPHEGTDSIHGAQVVIVVAVP